MKLRPGKSDEWYTPKYIFDAIGLEFDLDPCSPGKEKAFVPAKRVFTKEDDGLNKEWRGRVWLNPPFGGRNGYFPWVEKFIENHCGIGLITSLTSSEGFQKFIPQMDGILFTEKKTRFLRPDLTVGGCPFTGICLFSIGEEETEALRKSKLGLFLKLGEAK